MIKNANLFSKIHNTNILVKKYLTSDFLDQIGLQSWRNLMRRFGTSYFWATLLLPSDIQKATVELYKFVRIPDEIVDVAHWSSCISPDLGAHWGYKGRWSQTGGVWEGGRRPEGFDQSTQLEDLYQDRQQSYHNRDVQHPIFGQRIQMMDEYKIDSDLVDSFYQAMRDDLTVSRYLTYEQLQWYMYGSAEVVGLMMTQIIWYDHDHKDTTIHWACKLWEAMQLTNFLRDVYEDCIDLDRIYMPQDILSEYDLSHDDIKQMCQNKAIDHRRIAYTKHMIKLCDEMYDLANDSVQYLTPSCRSAILLSSDLYREILRKIESVEYNQFAHSARTTRRDKFLVIAKRQVLCKIVISCFKD